MRGGKAGKKSRRAGVPAIRAPAFVDMGFANIDSLRQDRKGFPEVIFGQGKTPEQIVRIAGEMARLGQTVFVTRLQPEAGIKLRRAFKRGIYDPVSRTFRLLAIGGPCPKRGRVCIVCAGTCDIPVAEEAAVTAEIMGCAVERMYDVGVAGIHRLFAKMDAIKKADAVVVAAGMEGALPSVVSGLCGAPVIAVPTSVGYGASFSGLTALLGILNSCAPGVAAVNIDNGFGAGYIAAVISRRKTDWRGANGK